MKVFITLFTLLTVAQSYAQSNIFSLKSRKVSLAPRITTNCPPPMFVQGKKYTGSHSTYKYECYDKSHLPDKFFTNSDTGGCPKKNPTYVPGRHFRAENSVGFEYKECLREDTLGDSYEVHDQKDCAKGYSYQGGGAMASGNVYRSITCVKDRN